MGILETQQQLENRVTGGISSFAFIRTLLSFLAVAYDLLRKLSKDDIEYLNGNPNGQTILSFGATIQEMLGHDKPSHLWAGVSPTQKQDVTEENVPAEVLDKIRAQAHEEAREKLLTANLTLADLPKEGLREVLLAEAKELVAESVKQEVIDEAVSDKMADVMSAVNSAADSWASEIDDKKSCVSGQLDDAVCSINEIDMDAVREAIDALESIAESLDSARTAVESAQSDVDSYDAYDGAYDLASNVEYELD